MIQRVKYLKLFLVIFSIMSLTIRFDIGSAAASEDDENAVESSECSEESEEPGKLNIRGIIEMDGLDPENGIFYNTIKDTYFCFPEGTSEEDILSNIVKWVKETRRGDFDDEAVTVDMIFLTSETESSIVKLYGIAKYSGGIDVAGRHAVSACVEKCDEQIYKFVDYWEPSDADSNIPSIENRFPGEYYEAAEHAYLYDSEFADAGEQELQPCIVISGNTPEELILSAYSELTAYFTEK